MRVVVIGGGGREHAIVHSLRRSEQCEEIIAIPGNAGIANEAQCITIKPTDIDAVVNKCVELQADYVVVAPDDPLALGMVDQLALKGIPAFGPTADAAQIEASKSFAKDLMRDHDIPTAGYDVFTDLDAALAYVTGAKHPLVVKADGLALGKGVVICEDVTESTAAITSMMQDGQFGDSGKRIVIEEFLTGPEVSILAFCDGDTIVPMVTSMDHKRALDGDRGLNTGGMGAIAPNPYMTDALMAQCMKEILKPTVAAMSTRGTPFKGCLYTGIMLTDDGPKVIEYNCRFGDPETQVVLPLLESDLLEVMIACTEGRLTEADVSFANRACACVVMASGGYPEKYDTGFPIEGLDAAQALPDVYVFHAGTALKDNRVVTSGGRVLGVSAVADTIPAAIAAAYRAVDDISFNRAHYRRDIGHAAMGAS